MARRPFSVADRRRSVADLPDFTQPANGGPSVATRRVEPTAVPPGIKPQLPPFRPVTPRRKLLIVALTLTTVIGLAVLMLEPHRLLTAAKAARADAAALAACPPDAASAAPGCPGSAMPVLLLPIRRTGATTAPRR
jgi:hypothetical protein